MSVTAAATVTWVSPVPVRSPRAKAGDGRLSCTDVP